MEELISRQKAKDAIDMALDHIDHVPPWVYDNLLNALNEVPSAQPEIVRCKDCRHNYNCDIQYHAQAGDMFFCAGAKRRTDG